MKILIKISLRFAPKGPINNIPTFTDAYIRHSAAMS